MPSRSEASLLKNNWKLLVVVAAVLWMATRSWASAPHSSAPSAPEKASLTPVGEGARTPATARAAKVESPCATLVRWNGTLQILDQRRSDLIDLDENVGVPCGAWVTSQRGWAVFRHRLGHLIAVSAPTLFEVTGESDIVTLYRGQVMVQAADGAPQARVVTANGRVKVSRGAALVTYLSEQEETQLVALERDSVLENRYESNAYTEVRAGESTTLSLGSMKIIPSRAKVVSAASLKEHLASLPLDDRYKDRVVKIAQMRVSGKSEKVIEQAVAKSEKSSGEVRGDQRKPASTPPEEEGVGTKMDSKEKARVLEELSKIHPTEH